MSSDHPNYLKSNEPAFFSTRTRSMRDIFKEMGVEVDAEHHRQEGYRQGINKAIELINRPDFKNRREIIAALEARRDTAIATDNSDR